MNKRNYIVFDLETSGRSPESGHEIVQIAAKAVNSWNLEDYDIDPFHVYLKPQNPDKASDRALQIIGDVWDKAQNEGVDPKIGLKAFIDWIEEVNDSNSWISRPIMCGHNISTFDLPFLKHWLLEYKIISQPKDEEKDPEYPWSILVLDTWPLLFTLFETDPTMTSFSLDACLSKMNLSRSSDKHDALEDVELNKQMLVRYMKFLRECKKRVRTK